MRILSDRYVGVSFGESVTKEDTANLLLGFGIENGMDLLSKATYKSMIPVELKRTVPLLTHPIFNSYHSETEMMRYLKHLENMDLSLNTSMIPLGTRRISYL